MHVNHSQINSSKKCGFESHDRTKGFHRKTARQNRSQTDNHHLRQSFIWQLSLCGNYTLIFDLENAPCLPTSAKRANMGCFCRAKAFIRNNNAADRLTAFWFAIEKQENERNVRDREVCSGFSLRGRPVVELGTLR